MVSALGLPAFTYSWRFGARMSGRRATSHYRKRSHGCLASNERSRTTKQLRAHHDGPRTARWPLAYFGVGTWANALRSLGERRRTVDALLRYFRGATIFVMRSTLVSPE